MINGEQDLLQDTTVIIGGGVAGLTTAAFLARAGKSVTILEQSSEVGGRARTAVFDGFYFNQGPHALYLSDIGVQILKEIGVIYTGGKINYNSSSNGSGGKAGTTSFGIKKGKLLPLPTSRKAVLTSKLIGIKSKLEFGKIFDLLGKTDFSKIENVTVTEWLDENAHRHSDIIEIVKAFVRLNTYGNDPDIQSAGSALQQLSRAFYGGVMYLDEGWQTLVDGLVKAATNNNNSTTNATTKIITGKKATKIERRKSSQHQQKQEDAKWLITLSDGSLLSSSTVVLATSPKEAHELFDEVDGPEVLSKAAAESKPVRMACLDISLSNLPNKNILFALGIDSPLYFSVHSAYVRLAFDLSDYDTGQVSEQKLAELSENDTALWNFMRDIIEERITFAGRKLTLVQS